jgi:RNA polymerase sigma-70 factor (ECF subfamily)
MRERPLRVVRTQEPPPALSADTSLPALFQRYAPYVAAIGARLLGRSADVEDLVQDVFLAAHSGLKALHHPEAIKGWLTSVTVRMARRKLRRQKWLVWLGADHSSEYLDVADAAASPADRTLLAQVYRILERVRVDDRIAWTLHRVQGASLEEVGRACGCSMATAKRRVRAAQETLDAEMNDE